MAAAAAGSFGPQGRDTMVVCTVCYLPGYPDGECCATCPRSWCAAHAAADTTHSCAAPISIASLVADRIYRMTPHAHAMRLVVAGKSAVPRVCDACTRFVHKQGSPEPYWQCELREDICGHDECYGCHSLRNGYVKHGAPIKLLKKA